MGILARIGRALGDVTKPWFSPSWQDLTSPVAVGTPVTKTQISNYISSAHMGETTYLSVFKQEMRASDSDLESHILKLENMLTQAPFEITRFPPVPLWKRQTKTADDQKADDIAVYCRDQLTDPDIKIGEVIKHALWGQLEGVTGSQVLVKSVPKSTFTAAPNPEKLLSLEAVPSERFRWINLRFMVQTGDSFGDVVPVSEMGDALAAWVSQPNNLSRDRVGPLRRCIVPWLTGKYGLEWWGQRVQLVGIPYRKVKYKGSKTEKELSDLDAKVKAMGPAGYGLFPDWMDAEFITAAAGSRNEHDDLVGYCDRAKAKVLLGSTQTAEIQPGSGSRQSAEIHMMIVETFAEAYGQAICADLRAQVLKPMVRRAWGLEASERFTPVPVIRVRSNANLLSLMQALEIGGKAGMKTIPVGWIHSQAGVPLPEDGEPCLVYPGPGAAIPGVGGPPEPGDPGAQAASRAKPTEGHPLEGPAKTLQRLEEWAVSHSRGSGDSVLAPYVELIQETLRDGGDLGHLASRIRLQAQMAGKDHQETADILAAVMAEAILTGFTRA